MIKSEYSIFVAEDEPRLQRSLIKKINDYDRDFSVIGSALDGQTAYEEIKRLEPDILFTDIKMPELSGLELIEKLSRENSDIIIIIISGYNDFSLAKQALKLQVKDYLLKPVSLTDIHKILDDIRVELQVKVSRWQQDDLENIIYKKYDDVSQLNFPAVRYGAGIICFGNYRKTFTESQGCECIKSLRDLVSRQYTIFGEDLNTFFFPDSNRANLCLLAIQKPQSNISVGRIFQSILDKIREEDSLSQKTILFNPDFISADELSRNYRHLSEMISLCICPGKEQLINIADIGSFQTVQYISEEEIRELSVFSLFNKKREFSDSLDMILEKIFLQNSSQHNIILAFDNLINELGKYKKCDTTELIILFPDKMKRLKLIEDIKTQVIGCFISEDNKLTPKGITDYICLYIDNEFTTDLSISDLSGQLGYDVSYLTRLFTREKGLSPKSYLIKKRIEEAKRLFRLIPNLNIHQVAESVGYDDPHYFTRIFKKYTGRTPSEFIECL